MYGTNREYQETGRTFDLSVCVYKEYSQASVRITDYHTNIVQIEKSWELIRDDLKDEKIEKANRYVQKRWQPPVPMQE